MKVIWKSGVELSNSSYVCRPRWRQVSTKRKRERDRPRDEGVINIWLNKPEEVHSANKTNKEKEMSSIDKDKWDLPFFNQLFIFNISFTFERIPSPSKDTDEQLIRYEDCLLRRRRRRCSFLPEWTLKNQTYILFYLLALVTWRHALRQRQQQDETRNYMYHLTYHRRNMSLYTLTLRSVRFISNMGVHGKFRLNWTLKHECQFHVKSLFLFRSRSLVLPSTLECETVRFRSWPNQGLIFTHLHDRRAQIQAEHAHRSLAHELYLKVSGNLSYVNAKSQEEEEEGEGRALLYNKDINIYIHVFTHIQRDMRVCVCSLKRWPSERLELHGKAKMMIAEESPFEIGRPKHCHRRKDNEMYLSLNTSDQGEVLFEQIVFVLFSLPSAQKEVNSNKPLHGKRLERMDVAKEKINQVKLPSLGSLLSHFLLQEDPCSFEPRPSFQSQRERRIISDDLNSIDNFCSNANIPSRRLDTFSVFSRPPSGEEFRRFTFSDFFFSMFDELSPKTGKSKRVWSSECD